ncbi:MAG: HAMP domain-containing sensor histidine kinase [Pseudomonadota bacterium]
MSLTLSPQVKFRLKLAIVAGLLAGVTLLHYSHDFDQMLRQVVIRDLYLIPMMLGAFWFGLRGGVAVGLTLVAALLPMALLETERNPRWLVVDALEFAIYMAAGMALGWLRDRERAQQRRMREAESLAAMGRAVSAVAHDMRTPLMTIGGFTTQLRRNLNDDDPAAHKMDIIISQTRRLEHMVQDMLDFSRPLELHPTPVDPAQFLEECLALAEPLATQAAVNLTWRGLGQPGALHLDGERVQQALLNLIANAVQASPPGSGVTIIVNADRADEVRLEVADQGPGIPHEQRPLVLQPFYTTKREGNGLGLSIVRKIVEAHGGRLEMRENQPRGMIFSLVLPQSGPSPRPPAALAASTP